MFGFCHEGLLWNHETNTTSSLNRMMLGMQVMPGAGNPGAISVEITATGIDVVTGLKATATDAFTIPILVPALGVLVDAGSDIKAPLYAFANAPAVNYPITAIINGYTADTDWQSVDIDYSSDCNVAPKFDFGSVPSGVVVDATSVSGRISLNGDYNGVNEALDSLLITPPDLGNDVLLCSISVKVTATGINTKTNLIAVDVDEFRIPVVAGPHPPSGELGVDVDSGSDLKDQVLANSGMVNYPVYGTVFGSNIPAWSMMVM